VNRGDRILLKVIIVIQTASYLLLLSKSPLQLRIHRLAILVHFDGGVDLVVEVQTGEEPHCASDEEDAQTDHGHVSEVQQDRYIWMYTL